MPVAVFWLLSELYRKLLPRNFLRGSSVVLRCFLLGGSLQVRRWNPVVLRKAPGLLSLVQEKPTKPEPPTTRSCLESKPKAGQKQRITTSQKADWVRGRSLLKATRAAMCNTSEREQSAQQPTAFQKETTGQAQGAQGLPALACKPHAAARAHAPLAHCAPGPQTHTNGNPSGGNAPRPSAHPHRARACRVVLEVDAATRDTGASGRPLCHTAYGPPFGKPPIDNTGILAVLLPTNSTLRPPAWHVDHICAVQLSLPPLPRARLGRPSFSFARRTTIALIVVRTR